MAIWQYTFFIIPSSNSPLSNPVENIDEDGLFDDSIYWENSKIHCNAFSGLQLVLPRSQSWSKDIILFGDERSNVIQILCENNLVVSASLRIDFSQDYDFVLRYVIEFFTLNNLILVDEELNITPLNFENLQAVINSSSQNKKYRSLF